MTGKCNKGNTLAYGDYGLVALEPAWIKSNQIEAARIAMTRFIKRGGKVWIDIFPHKPITKSPRIPEWVPVKVRSNTGRLSSSPAE